MILPRYSHRASIDYHLPFSATNLHGGLTTISWYTQRNIAKLHKWVGERIVQCMVTRLAELIGRGNDDVEQQHQGDHRDEGRNGAPTKESRPQCGNPML